MINLNDSKQTYSFDDFDNTSDIEIPNDPLERVIGQSNAVDMARIAASQRRHLLIVGPPGTGKSMIARAMSLHLGRPKEEIQVVHNPENPQRPFVEVKRRKEVIRDSVLRQSAEGELINPHDAPDHVTEQLGYRCTKCHAYSSPGEMMCPNCNAAKGPQMKGMAENPFGDMLGGLIQVTMSQVGGGKNRVQTTINRGNKEEVVVYEKAGDMVRQLDQKSLEKRRTMDHMKHRKVLVPLDRDPFVLSTGASEVELLGDVQHDPYGGHPNLGIPTHERVTAGSIHESHEGVLFIDELPHLGHLQHYILTAMQEKEFPISGRHPQSAGASVKVEHVPCDFIFVGACNIQDLQMIISPLRSRITGSGYEVLVETTMSDTEENQMMIAQFVAQEVNMDTRIPHATRDAVKDIVQEAKRRARKLDNADRALTLRLRELGGLVRIAGDLATVTHSEFIQSDHVRYAIKRSKSIEQQIQDRYGSFIGGMQKDISGAQREATGYQYWERHMYDDGRGYE